VTGIQEVLPGELLRYSRGNIARTRHWSLPEEGTQACADETALRQTLRARLEDAVRRRLPGEEPIGAFLSGGIDSSLVVALARKAHEPPLHTYSVSFGPDYPNELAFSSLVATHCQTRHHVVEISSSMMAREFDSTMAMLDKPIGDPLTVPNALLFRAAGADVGIVLNGEGGDPCFGGPEESAHAARGTAGRRGQHEGGRSAQARAQLSARSPEVLRRPRRDARSRGP
jgi:asparagine synthase (glutamine-hydrolysing)